MKAALSAIVVLACLAAPRYAPAQAIEPGRAPPAAGSEFFEKRIRPLLAEHCYQCHGKEKQESGLVLASFAAIRKGGDRGTLLVAGDPEQSLLIQAVGYAADDLKMPPRGKLKEEQIADLVTWVKLGAPGPQQEEAPSVVTLEPAKEFDLAERRKHWAYQPVLPQPVPAVSTPEWSRSPIDRFILSRLDSAGLSPSPSAEKRSLIRRITFALTGLPPTPEEVATFLADQRPDAYERQIDRLLASPRFGERWGRHWLDVVRYSETLGFEFDYDLHNAWRYRDYVVRAFNADLPYDQFVVEHLAGDLLEPPRRNPADGCNESILATGFFWMHEGKQTPVDIRQEQADRIDNQIDVLGKALLGQTIACARCHDHKFDAITTRDYYALAGYLKSSRYQQAFLDPPERMAGRVAELSALRTRIDAAARAELAPVWLRQAKNAGRYLLATRQVTAAADGKTNAAQVASEAGLDATRLERWHKAVQHESTANPAHPLRAWSQRVGKEVSQLESDSTLPAFEEWSLTNSAGWFKTGDAFQAPPLPAGQVVVGSGAARPIARLTTRGTDSGQVSLRLQGELRSPSFTLARRYVHFRVAGQSARVNLVIDGYTLIMNPMYGKLTTTPASSVPSWHTMPVDRWVGHRAFIEVSDSTIPMHRLNPPASTARVDHGADGHLVLEDVVFSDDPNPPHVSNRTNFAFAKRAAGGDLDSLAAAYETLIAELISRWQSGQLLDAPDTEGGIDLLNWLLENGLLDGEPEASDAARCLALVTKYRELEAALPQAQRAPALADGTGEDEFVFLRGNYRTLGERATRGPPEALTVLPTARNATEGVPDSAGASAGSGRLELARRLADPSNPLLNRVLVNRIWQHVFGEGLVRTPDDFGRMGQPPTHPELLDQLAVEFVRGEWSVKTAVRRMLASQTYRQRSNVRSQESERDPENRLLHRMPIRRLEAEAIRDATLAVSGRLNLELHGPSVLPHVTLHMEGRGKPGSGALDGEGRRSLYINARRNFLTPLLLAFDYPVTFTPIGRRGASALPSQALTLMNDPFVIQETTRWANRVIEQERSNTEQRIASLYETAFARPPTDDEVTAAIDFLQAQSLRHGVGSEDPRVWADLCHVLINVKEFIFID